MQIEEKDKILKKILEILLEQDTNLNKQHLTYEEFFNKINKEDYLKIVNLLFPQDREDNLVNFSSGKPNETPKNPALHSLIRINKKGKHKLEELRDKEETQLEKLESKWIKKEKLDINKQHINMINTQNKIIKGQFWVYVGIGILTLLLVIVGIFQAYILNQTSLSNEPNLRVWYEGRYNPIPIHIEALTNPELWSNEGSGYGLNLCVRNLAKVKISSVNFHIKENNLFDSSNEVFNDVGLDRQCKDIRIRQKNCSKDNKKNCNQNLFKDGDIIPLTVDFMGEGKVWPYDINICVYRENEDICNI